MAWVSIETDLPQTLTQEVMDELAKDMTNSIKEGTALMKQHLRQATASGWKSRRLPYTWRATVYPQNGNSIDAAGSVEVRRSAAAIIESGLKSTVIRARNKTWLALPTKAAGRFGIKVDSTGQSSKVKITPTSFEASTGLKLRVMPSSDNNEILLVADLAMLSRGRAVPYQAKGRGSKKYGPSGQTVIVFVLKRYVKTQQRLDLEEAAQNGASRAANLFVSTHGG